MDAVYEELDEVKAEVERLKEQCKVKSELAEGLKRAHSEEVNKNKEVNSRLEKLTQKLQEKEDEIANAEQVCEELRSGLKEKGSVIKDLSLRYDKLRSDCNEKIRKLEEANRDMGLSLDDVNGKNMDKERIICGLKEQVEGMKRSLSLSVKNSLVSENQKQICKELEGKKVEFDRLEDESRKFEDQLKWKKEQFNHLQEAHEKLQNVMKVKEKEWEKDRGELLDAISSLESNLESQKRICRDLECRLEMCNQALAHSESKRKQLEGELLESKSCFDSICAEYDDAKSTFEKFSVKRDQDIATLRSCLSTKEILYKEMEYQFRKLEQEKQDLMVTLKELQEDRIRESGLSSASKIQKKLKSLELLHKGCEVNLKAKESEWLSLMEKLSEELKLCRSELENRDMSMRELKKELQYWDTLMMKLEQTNQEVSLSLLVLKSEFSEAQIRVTNDCSNLNLTNNQLQQHVLELVEQMENKKAAIDSIQKDLEEEREKVSLLTSKIQVLEQLQSPLQQEVDRLKEMLEVSKLSKLESQEQVAVIENDLKMVHDALNRANEELYNKYSEVSEIEFELQVWKSLAEQMDETLRQNLRMRGDVEASLLSQTDVELNLKLEKECLTLQLEEKEKHIENLQLQLEVKEATFDLQQLVEEKDQRIYDLQQLVASLEKEFESSTNSFSSKLAQMQTEIQVLRESWESIKESAVLKEMEIQEKNMMITELENEMSNLMYKLKEQEKAHNLEAQIIQAELEAKLLETHNLETKLITADATIKTLSENSFCLSSENENLMNNMASLWQKMEQITQEETQLIDNWGKLVHTSHVSTPPTKENMDSTPSQSQTKKKLKPFVMLKGLHSELLITKNELPSFFLVLIFEYSSIRDYFRLYFATKLLL